MLKHPKMVQIKLNTNLKKRRKSILRTMETSISSMNGMVTHLWYKIMSKDLALLLQNHKLQKVYSKNQRMQEKKKHNYSEHHMISTTIPSIMIKPQTSIIKREIRNHCWAAKVSSILMLMRIFSKRRDSPISCHKHQGSQQVKVLK